MRRVRQFGTVSAINMLALCLCVLGEEYKVTYHVHVPVADVMANGRTVFVYVKEKRTWNDASQACRSLFPGQAASLAKVDSQEAHQMVIRLLENESNGVWFGLYNDGNTGQQRKFMWSDVTCSHFEFGNLAKFKTAPDEDGDGQARCYYLADKGLTWNKDKCSPERSFLCEYQESTNSTCGGGDTNGAGRSYRKVKARFYNQETTNASLARCSSECTKLPGCFLTSPLPSNSLCLMGVVDDSASTLVKAECVTGSSLDNLGTKDSVNKNDGPDQCLPTNTSALTGNTSSSSEQTPTKASTGTCSTVTTTSTLMSVQIQSTTVTATTTIIFTSRVVLSATACLEPSSKVAMEESRATPASYHTTIQPSMSVSTHVTSVLETASLHYISDSATATASDRPRSTDPVIVIASARPDSSTDPIPRTVSARPDSRLNLASVTASARLHSSLNPASLRTSVYHDSSLTPALIRTSVYPDSSPDPASIRTSVYHDSSPDAATVRTSARPDSSPDAASIRTSVYPDSSPDPASIRTSVYPDSSPDPASIRTSVYPDSSPDPASIKTSVYPDSSPDPASIKTSVYPDSSPGAASIRTSVYPDSSPDPASIKTSVYPDSSPDPASIKTSVYPDSSPDPASIKTSVYPYSSPDPASIKTSVYPDSSPGAASIKTSVYPDSSPGAAVSATVSVKRTRSRLPDFTCTTSQNAAVGVEASTCVTATSREMVTVTVTACGFSPTPRSTLITGLPTSMMAMTNRTTRLTATASYHQVTDAGRPMTTESLRPTTHTDVRSRHHTWKSGTPSRTMFSRPNTSHHSGRPHPATEPAAAILSPDIDEMTSAIINDLLLNERELSKSRRTRESATDVRVSAQVSGGLAMLILCAVLSCVIIMDIPRVLACVRDTFVTLKT